MAVIGFRNLSERPADEWLSTAMAEMLTTELAGDGQLRVLPAERVARANVDLGQHAAITLSQDALDRLRNALASDWLVFGTFIINEGTAPRTVRIDVRLHRAGQDPISVSSTGDQAELFALVANVGQELRAHLGLHESPADTTRSVRAAFPQTADATRLYAEGTARLRVLDAVGGKDLLEQAAAREPTNPMIQIGIGGRMDGAWLRRPRGERRAESLRLVGRSGPRAAAERRRSFVQRAAKMAERGRCVPHALGLLFGQRRIWTAARVRADGSGPGRGRAQDD